jgi:hypothetical protein
MKKNAAPLACAYLKAQPLETSLIMCSTDINANSKFDE